MFSMSAKPILVSWDITCTNTSQCHCMYMSMMQPGSFLGMMSLNTANLILMISLYQRDSAPLVRFCVPANHAKYRFSLLNHADHQKLGDIIFLVWPRLGLLRPIEPLEDLVRNPGPCPEEGKIEDCTCMKSTNRTGRLLWFESKHRILIL